MVNAMILLLSFQLAGEIITRSLALPLPGPVAGMLLLFTALLVRDSLLATVEETAQYILKNLTLLYVPAAVGVMVHLDLVRREGAPIVITLLGSAIITIIVTAVTMRLLQKYLFHPKK